jgi:uncharacterized iron-regulated protein
MKIQGENPFKLLGAYLRGEKGVKSAKESPPPVAAKAVDRVEISTKYSEAQRLSKIVSKEPDIREERVYTAQRDLAAGKKIPDAKVLAESLVRAAVLDKIV